MAAKFDEERFRSFVERYICARASKFGVDEMEMADAHACVSRARSIYFHIENVAHVEGQRIFEIEKVREQQRHRELHEAKMAVMASVGGMKHTGAWMDEMPTPMTDTEWERFRTAISNPPNLGPKLPHGKKPKI